LTFLDDYLAIESARFEGRVTVSIQAADDLLPLRVPGFLLQPLVENAIRHGVSKRLAGGHVEVTASRDGQTLRLRVRDNGVGLSAQWQFPRDAGIGLEHLYGRANLLQIAPAIPEGVEVKIEVPLEHKS
jgi:LytS/YehU family sensor histidine kinase